MKAKNGISIKLMFSREINGGMGDKRKDDLLIFKCNQISVKHVIVQKIGWLVVFFLSEITSPLLPPPLEEGNANCQEGTDGLQQTPKPSKETALLEVTTVSPALRRM